MSGEEIGSPLKQRKGHEKNSSTIKASLRKHAVFGLPPRLINPHLSCVSSKKIELDDGSDLKDIGGTAPLFCLKFSVLVGCK